MIIGTGIDIVELKRISRIVERQEQAFLRKIMTKNEIERVPQGSLGRKVEYVSGRYAAKEACAKALGTGIGAQLSFGDIEIVANALGKPEMHLLFDVQERMGIQNRYQLHLSISHSREYAVAQVIIESV